ncbi:MAG: hypothetical protein JNL95_12520, partial [Chitinophagales bacterium]|nr:hypothetical protein [Chitinophagales bacterium]
MNKNFTKFHSYIFLCIGLVLWNQSAFAQCNVAGGSALPAATCAVQTVSLGAGEYRTLATTASVVYEFGYTNNAQSNGSCVSGTQQTANPVNSTPGGGTINVGIYRNSGTWNGTSAVLSYRIAPATPASAGGAQNICGSLVSSSLGGNTPTVGTGTWAKASGPGTVSFSNINTGSSTVTVSAYGTYTFTWTINNGGCTSVATTGNINFYQNPTITAPASVCDNSTAAVSANVGTITVSAGTWSAGTFTPPNLTPPTQNQNVTITATNGTCTPTQVIRVDNLPTITAPTAVCDNTTAAVTQDVTGTTQSASLGTWSGGTFTPPNVATPTANQNITLTATNGSCAPTQSIRVDNSPTITSPTAVCENATATVTQDVTGTTQAASAGTWVGSTFTPPTIAGATQNQTVTFTATNGVCVTTVPTIRVDNNTTAAAGLDQSQCNNGNFTLAGNDPTATVTGSTGTWTCQANCAGISYVSASTFNTSMSSVPANTTTTSRWTVVNGVCSNFDDVNTRNDGQPVISGASSLCDVDGTVSYTQTGGSSIVWSYTGSGASINSTTGDLTVTNIATPTQSVSGTVTATGGSCSANRAVTIYNKTSFTNSFASLCEGQNVTLTADVTGTTFSGTGVSGGVFTAPTIGGTSQSFILTATNGPTSCQDQQIITVYKVSNITSSSADMCQGNTRTLTATPGPGAFTSVACPSCVVGTTFTAPVPSGNSQVIDIVYTVSGAPCSATQNITVWRTPSTATVGSTQNVCGLTSSSLGGNTPTYGTGTWSQVSGPGTSTFSASGSGSSTATATTYGTYVYRWTISNGPCTATTADITVVYNAPAAVPTSGGDQEACYRQSVPDLTVTVGGGETADWYDAASGGTLVKTGSLTFNEAIDGSGPNPIPGTYTYYAEGRNTTTNCPSTSRVAVTLTIRAVPVISPTATPNTACSGDAVILDANATAGSGTITAYAWSSGLGAVASGTVNPTSTTTYTVTVTNSYSCTNDASATVTIKTGAAYVVLPPSTVTTAVEQCSDGGWTYYANASTPDDWIFAIRKNGNTFTAEVDITVLGSRATVDNINTTKAGWEHGSYLMTRYWNATVLTGSISTPVDVKFYYDPAEKTDAESARDAAWASYTSTTKTAFRWFKTVGTSFGSTQINAIDGNSFNAFSNITLTESASGTDNGVTYAQFNGITSFSGGTGGYGFSGAPAGLPVKLIDFTATAVENSYIRLDWSTALEINNAGFEIERSTNGADFAKIGWVKGNDNSTSTIAYSFDDKTAQPNIRYYYRLKQIDNGNVAFEYSNIVSAMFINEGKTAVGDF